ncbi:MAG: FecR domain-containing protein [Pseudomonadota bacterium]
MQESEPEQNSKDDLIEEALALVEQDRIRPRNTTRNAITDFAQQSEQHSAALHQAQQFFDVAAGYKAKRRSPLNQLKYQLELITMRLAEPRAAFTAVGLLVLAITGLFWFNQQDTTPPLAPVATMAPEPQWHETQGQQQRTVTLADGSTIWLGWRTRLEVEFTGATRQVRLHQGVAAFAVETDPARPFIVYADKLRTTVTGTEFVVNRQRHNRIEVAVLEGAVSVKGAGDATATALTGEQAVVAEHGVIGAVLNRSTDEIGSWREGILVFEDRPLLDALAALEPYSRYRMDTRLIADHKGLVSGVFFTDQADDALISILTTHQISPHQDGHLLKLRRQRPSRPGQN